MNTTVEKIVKEGILDQIIKNITKESSDEDLKDLKQDIYLTLLEKDEVLLAGIIERGQMPYYLTRIVLNNINSKTSRFYYKYKRHKNKETITDNIPNEPTEEPDY